MMDMASPCIMFTMQIDIVMYSDNLFSYVLFFHRTNKDNTFSTDSDLKGTLVILKVSLSPPFLLYIKLYFLNQAVAMASGDSYWSKRRRIRKATEEARKHFHQSRTDDLGELQNHAGNFLFFQPNCQYSVPPGSIQDEELSGTDQSRPDDLMCHQDRVRGVSPTSQPPDHPPARPPKGPT